jgi:hypothetical protein
MIVSQRTGTGPAFAIAWRGSGANWMAAASGPLSISSTCEHGRMENGAPFLREDRRRLESPDQWGDAKRELPDDLGDRRDALYRPAVVVEVEPTPIPTG